MCVINKKKITLTRYEMKKLNYFCKLSRITNEGWIIILQSLQRNNQVLQARQYLFLSCFTWLGETVTEMCTGTLIYEISKITLRMFVLLQLKCFFPFYLWCCAAPSLTLFCNHEHLSSMRLLWIQPVPAWSLSWCTLSLCCRVLRFPNGEWLRLTRKYHYHFPFKAVPWMQNKQEKALLYRRASWEVKIMLTSLIQMCAPGHIRPFILSLSRHWKHFAKKAW